MCFGTKWGDYYDFMREQFKEECAKLSNDDLCDLHPSSYLQKDWLSKCGLDEQKM
jgi:hypothetical protein